MKSRTGKIRFLLPVLGFLCFLGFQFLKSEPDQITDVNTFLKTRLAELVRAFDENGNGELCGEEVYIVGYLNVLLTFFYYHMFYSDWVSFSKTWIF